MCLKRLNIFNPSRSVPSVGGSLRLSVPCGECFECKEKKKAAYFVRTFAEYQRLEAQVKRREAVVYFDTLTYDSKNLPIWNGIPVFNHKHIQDFLKRLRRSLEYDGYSVNDNLKYFICSEFGEKKGRPHYHILLFLGFWLEPRQIWRYVRDAWQLGRTDRLHPTVKKGKFYGGAADRYVDRNGALQYVSGYVVKDSAFYDQFNTKVRELVEAGHDFKDSELRSVKPRFFLSRGFGLSFIDNKQLEYHYDYEYYRKTLKVTISDQKHLKRDFALPEYYRRKIFFNLRYERLPGELRDENGEVILYKRGPNKGLPVENRRYYWEPNDDYIQFQHDTIKDSIKQLTNHYHDIFNNISPICLHSSGDNLRQWITDHLLGRSFQQVATYAKLYRQKLCLTDRLYTSGDAYLQEFYNSKLITLKHVPENKRLDKLSMQAQEEHLILHQLLITQNICDDFKYFDDIIDVLEEQQSIRQRNVAQFKENLRQQKRKLKNLTNYFY